MVKYVIFRQQGLCVQKTRPYYINEILFSKEKSSFLVDFLVQQYWFLNLLENFYIQTEISNNIKILIMIEIIMQKIYKKLIKYLRKYVRYDINNITRR